MLPIIPIAMMVASAAMGKAKADAANSRRQKEMMARAQEQEGSPWTGMGPTTQVSPGESEAGGIFGGAVSGLAMSQSLNGAMSGAPTPEAPAVGGLDPNMQVGGQQTALGNIGAQGMEQPAQESAQAFNNPYGGNLWSQGAQTLYGSRSPKKYGLGM